MLSFLVSVRSTESRQSILIFTQLTSTQTRITSSNNSYNMSVRPSPVLIYAELLSNIRQVSVGCSLQTERTSSTQAVVSPDGLTFSLSHDGVERSIQLPGRVVAPGQLPSATRGPKSLAWRLAVAPTTIAVC